MSNQRDASNGGTKQVIADNHVAIDQPSMDASGAAAERATPSFGVAMHDSVWVTECAWCERMRSNAGDWHTLSPAVRAAMRVELTHGICPQCVYAALARADEAIDGASP
jgi:hypothetical protein